MNAKELAGKLNGNEYRDEISKELIAEAKASKLVVVLGGSDDLIEFYGSIDDEAGCSDEAIIYLNADGLLLCRCEYDDCPYFQELITKTTKTIKAYWNVEGYSWIYETKIPHKIFEILDDGEKYCRGIVFHMDDLKEQK